MSEVNGREPMLQQPEPVLCYVSGSYAYFTTCPLNDQWGDDWNDAPYEHNAGAPYTWREYMREDGIEPYRIVCIMWDGPFVTPEEGHHNSPFSVDAINAGAIAWLRPEAWAADNTKPIAAGTTLGAFKQAIKDAGGHIWVREE